MTFGGLLTRYQFEDIVQEFVHLWEHNTAQPLKDTDIKNLKTIYSYLQALQPTQSRYYIRLYNRWENCSPMVDMNCSIYGINDNKLICPVAAYPILSEVLDMNILINEDVLMTPQELNAGLLWEITYYGELYHDLH